MITFRARMYNVTSGEYCNNTPTEYSFSEYYGYTGVEETTDVMLGQDGRTLTNIPDTRFSHNRSTNVGTWFEYYAKMYYDVNSAWPVLRLLTSNDINSYYLEWDHSSPNGFFVKSDTSVSRWEYVFQWTDAFNTQYTDDRKYNLYYSSVFIASEGISDLIEPGSIKYAGAFRFNDTTGTFDVLVGSNMYNISVTNEDCLKYDAGTYLGRVGSRYFYKSYNGTTIAMFVINTGNSWRGPITIAPYVNNQIPSGWSPYFTYNTGYPSDTFTYGGIIWAQWSQYHDQTNDITNPDLPVFDFFNIEESMGQCGIVIGSNAEFLYYYLQGRFTSVEPPSDVDPDNPPDPDTPPTPQPPDNPDPYYDPESDPDNPDYDPTKDPSSPDYDPTVPHTPFTPPSGGGGGGEPALQPPQDDIPAPETPPSYVTTNALFTLYNPSGADLTNLANFLWSPAWSIDTFKKIFANPLDCILGLMVMPYLAVSVGTKNMNVGNIDTGVAMHYFTKQFFDFNCGDFTIEEFYRSYLDYAPYTKVSIFLPYIGDQQLNADEVMGKTLNVKYRFDLATGDCVAFISVDGSVLYSFSGNCAARLPLSASNYGGLIPSITGAVVGAGSLAAGVPALGAASALAVSSMKQDIRHTGSISGSAGLMGVQTPYLIITRPRQALPLGQNSFTGYPSFITESLGGLTGYTEVEACHLEHIPCTDEELREIEQLLKGGVLF